MAGKLIADQIEHSTAGSLDTSYVVNGSAKAWVAKLDSGASAAASFNFSSFTDNGSNNTATFTNSMTSGYAVVCSADEPQPSPVARFVTVFARGASSFGMHTYTDTGGTSSVPQHAIIQGDLA